MEIELSLADLGISLGETSEGLLASAERSLVGRGKGKAELSAFVTRDLTQADIDQANERSVGVSSSAALSKLRDRHHMVAQMLARGLRPTDIANITGYSVSRISVLKADAAFAELVEMYRGQAQEVFSNTLNKMKALTDDALEVLQERLEENPESLTNTHLLKLVEAVGDRAGFAPTQKNINFNVPVDADRISAIKNRVKQRQVGEVKQITQEATSATYKIAESNQGLIASENLRGTDIILEGTEA